MSDGDNNNEKPDMMLPDDELECVIIDEVLETEQIDDDGNFVLVIRSGKGIAGLVFSPERAREAAVLLTDTANAIEGE